MTFDDALAMAERQLGWLLDYTHDEAHDLLLSGHISQAKWELYCDVQNVSAFYLVTDARIVAESAQRLIDRYSS